MGMRASPVWFVVLAACGGDGDGRETWTGELIVRWLLPPAQVLAAIGISAVHDGSALSVSISCTIGSTTSTPVAVANDLAFHSFWLRFDGTTLRCGRDDQELLAAPACATGCEAGITLSLFDTGAGRFDNVVVARP
jgi:hypothetical protein